MQAQLKVDVPTEFYRNILRDGDLPDNVEGSPYFNEDFKSGTVHIKENEPFSAMLRYDAFRDNLEMKKGDKFTSLLKREYISAKIGNEVIKIFEYTNDSNELREGYFTQLNRGKIQLLKMKKKVFKPAKENSSTYKKDSPPRLIDEINYYLTVNNEVAEKIKLRKKSVLSYLSAFPEAKEIAKQREMKLSSENEVIQLIQLLNTNSGEAK
jgi:hypothetical protein